MLDYATCAALKAAGYPQDEQCSQFYSTSVNDADSPRWNDPVLLGGGHDRREWCSDAECPNSDELIAAIQARWPDYGVALTTNMSWSLNPPGPARIDGYYAWVIGRDSVKWDDSVAEGRGNSPAEALAALYLALAGGE